MRVLEKILVIAMVFLLVMSYFFNIAVSLAVSDDTELQNQNNSTNLKQVNFEAFFKNQGTNSYSIKNSVTKGGTIYISISLNESGWIDNGKIEFKDANFEVVQNNDKKSQYIEKIENNIVYLNRITYGQNVELELPIKFNKNAEIAENYINRNTQVNFTGIYQIDDTKSKAIETTKLLNNIWEENPEVSISQDISKALQLNNGFMIEDTVTTEVKDDILPRKQETIELQVPYIFEQSPESIYVLLNGKRLDNNAINYDKENSKVTITNSNEPVNGNYKWVSQKNEYRIVLKYSGNSNFEGEKITLKGNINTEFITGYNVKNTLNNEFELAKKGSVITLSQNTTENLYKGYLYEKSELNTQYNETLKLDISNVEDIDNVEINFGEESFVYGEGEYSVNNSIFYESTKINKQNLFNILGETGKVEIYNQNNSKIEVITQNTASDNEGNIVINYNEEVTDLKFVFSKPVLEGSLQIENSKKIRGNTGYEKNVLKGVTELKNYISVSAGEYQKISSSINMLDTEYSIEAQISNSEFSTLEQNNDINLIGILRTDSSRYNLYKDPTLEFVFPIEITEVNVNFIKLLYDDELKISQAYMENNENGNLVLVLKLEGEQTKYRVNEITNGLNVMINCNIVVDNKAASKEEKIYFNVSNEGEMATKEITVNYKAPVGVTSVDTVSGYNNNEELKSLMGEQATGVLETGEEGKVVQYDNTIMNYNDSSIENVNILGKLPVSGNKNITTNEELGNNLDLSLDGNITVNGREDANIYYSSKEEVNSNLEDAQNEWTQDATNAKSYLIILQNPIQANEKIDITYNAVVPEGLEYNLTTSSMYKVNYSINNENKEYVTEPITLTTGNGPNLNVAVSALYGSENIYEEQILDMFVQITNEGDEVQNNITLKAYVPDGTNYIVFTQSNDGTRYEEKTDREIVWDIEKLEPGETYKQSYKLLVKEKTEGIDSIDFKADAVVEGFDDVFESNTITKKVNEASMSVRMSATYVEDAELINGSEIDYRIEVKNLTNEELKDVVLEDTLEENLKYLASYFLSDASNQADLIENNNYDEQQRKVTWNIDSIGAGETKAFILQTMIDTDKEEISLSNVAYAKLGDEQIPSNIISNQMVLPNITVEKSSSVDNEYIKENQEFEYYIKIKNEGNTDVNVEFFDVIPDGIFVKQMTYKLEGEEEVTEDVEYNSVVSLSKTIPAKKELNITLKVQANLLLDSEDQKEVVNSAEIRALGMEDKRSNEVVHIIEKDLSLHHLTIEKSSSVEDKYIKENQEFEYYIKIKNDAIKDITVEVLDEIPEGIHAKELIYQLNGEEAVSSDVSYNSTIYVNKTIPAGGELNITIKVQSDLLADEEEEKEVINVAQITTTELDSKESNEVVHIIEKDPSLHPDPDPGDPEDPEDPDPGDPDDPDPGDPDDPDPDNPDNPDPGDPDDPNPGDPGDIEDAIYIISGTAWVDENRDGIKDTTEKRLENISVSLLDVETNQFVKDASGNILTIFTGTSGEYTFSNLKPGRYMVIFQYNTEDYTVTKYKVDGVAERANSDAIERSIDYNNNRITAGITDEIQITDISISDIDIGLIQKEIFDLALEKSVGQVKVSSGNKTEIYSGTGQTITKVEIDAKKMNQATVEVEYIIKVKNEGEVPGYVNEIYDYLPEQLNFETSDNTGWKVEDAKIVNTTLENQIINPGEEKEVRLFLTKQMNQAEMGTIINTAEIGLSYNSKGIADRDSRFNNQDENEDDMSSAILIIGVKTGGTVLYISLILFSILILGLGIYFIKVKVLR